MEPVPVRAKVRERKTGYQFTIVFNNGTEKYFTKQCTEQTANEILLMIKNRIALNTFNIKDFHLTTERSISLQLYANTYLTYREKLIPSGKISIETWKKDYYSFKLFSGKVGKGILITAISPTVAIDFVNNLIDNNYTPSSINGYVKHLRAGFNWGVKNGKLKSNPFESDEIPRIKQENKKRVFTKNEISDYIKHTKTLPTRWKLDVFLIALNTGLRRSEIFKLTKNDLIITPKQGGGNIYNLRVQRKGNKIQVVPVRGKTTLLIKERIEILNNKYETTKILRASKQSQNPLAKERLKGGFLFFEITTPAAITREIREILDHLGIKARFHDLRKTYGTDLIEHGATLETASKLLGHADLRTTQTFYTEITSSKIIQEIQDIPEY